VPFRTEAAAGSVAPGTRPGVVVQTAGIRVRTQSHSGMYTTMSFESATDAGYTRPGATRMDVVAEFERSWLAGPRPLRVGAASNVVAESDTSELAADPGLKGQHGAGTTHGNDCAVFGHRAKRLPVVRGYMRKAPARRGENPRHPGPAGILLRVHIIHRDASWWIAPARSSLLCDHVLSHWGKT
jgi:hypothetical protein